MAIDATVGGASANSYVTIAEADAYFEARANSSLWSPLTDAEKEPYLVTAARRNDTEAYRGAKTEQAQALQFPRTNIIDEDGRSVDDDVIPDRVKRAQMEAAYAILEGSLTLKDSGLEQFSHAKVGPLEVDIRQDRAAGTLPQAVTRELWPWLQSSGATIRLVQA